MKMNISDRPELGRFYGIESTPKSCAANCFVLEIKNGASDLTTVARWSGLENGFEAPPAIGERVLVAMNRLGYGRVVAYFVEAGWLGIEVEPEPGQRPEWHIKQNKPDRTNYLVFGAEVKPCLVQAQSITETLPS